MLFKVFFSSIVLSFASSALAMPTVILDAGHEPSQPGALGTCNLKEVDYNDRLVATLAQTLQPYYQIILTRSFDQEVQSDNPDLKNYLNAKDRPLWDSKKKLLARPAMANLNHANVYISIHHDSTLAEQQQFDPTLCHHQGGKDLKEAFKKKYQIGYNIFIYNDEKNSNREQSLVLAQAMGRQLRAMGRIPSNYHRYPDDACQSCYPINPKLGVWHENLAVLRNATMPAVLIEVGNIVDSRDENIINNDIFRKNFSEAIKKSLALYFSSR